MSTYMENIRHRVHGKKETQIIHDTKNIPKHCVFH